MDLQTQLPMRFPCWCKATYSWGGETTKDLGFIEGDLIEALNAGDGLWWMGRLRRDPRAIGLFPSNFVTVLDESFTPAPNSRNPSVTKLGSNNSSLNNRQSIFQKTVSAGNEKNGNLGSFRGREDTPESDKERNRKERSRFRPYASMKTAQAPNGTIQRQETTNTSADTNGFRLPSTPPRGTTPRSRSPMPSRGSTLKSATPSPSAVADSRYESYRAASPVPSRPHSPLPVTFHDGSAYPQLLPTSRQPSPNPFTQQQRNSRPTSPAHSDFGPGSSPPPPPPAHRVAYQPSRPASPQTQHNFDEENAHTPIPPSPSGSHMTPSPLRDAINDVMSSLYDMSVTSSAPYTRLASSSNLWSPEGSELVRSQSRARPRTQQSRGFENHYESQDWDANDGADPALPSSQKDSHQLDSYVQRMEHHLRHAQSFTSPPPEPPLKDAHLSSWRPNTAHSQSSQESSLLSSRPAQQREAKLRSRKSAYELGRTYTTKTNVTNSTESSSATQNSTSTQLTSRSIMSGYSAGGFSATSAGSLARRKFGLGSQRGRVMDTVDTKSLEDIHSVAKSMLASEFSDVVPPRQDDQTLPETSWNLEPDEGPAVFGGFSSPKARKSGFFRKIIETAKTSAKTGAANARSTIGSASSSRPGSRAGSPTKGGALGYSGPTAISGGTSSRPVSSAGGAARDMGLGGSTDWMQVRRDVNRSNSLSRRERDDRAERCEMHDIAALNPIDQLNELWEGDEGLDGLPITEPVDFNSPNLALVDKSTRFIQSLPPVITPANLAQSYLCRPHRSDVKRLRAIFTWVSERIAWEDDFEGQVDPRRAIQSRRGGSEEIALLTRDMCTAVGLHAEIVPGYLKTPGETLDLEMLAHPNHWWNAVIVDGEWRILDCALAGPTHPRRSAYSSASSQAADPWYFLARPSEICYTHIPILPEQQHIVPPIPYEVLAALPCACPTYFRNGVEMADFNTSLLHLENLEMTQIYINVPADVECVAETEAKAYSRDTDGDFFENGDVVKKKSLAQAEWVGGRKRITVKALLPGDEGHAVLRVYAGKRGLMHSNKDNPHSLALTLPLSHAGQNPPYEFVTRHPTPHAQRHDLYIAQPQCSRLVMNNTFVFCIRQHPSSLTRFSPDTWTNAGGGNISRPISPNPMIRPTSAMSMVSATVSQSGSQASDSSNSGPPQPMTVAQQKPAKLAIQSPSQKIIRLTRKQEYTSRGGGSDEDSAGLTTSWETVIKIGERGTWRGLVLADRSARWCVFAEWECT